MKALAVLLFLLATPAYAEEPTIVISGIDPGGSLITYTAFWQRIADAGDSIKIDGVCISACTLFLGYVPTDRVCVTERASLGFHQASENDQPDIRLTQATVRWLYPRWVQDWIMQNDGLESNPKYMYPEDMKGHIKLCPGSEYNEISPDKLIHKEPPPPPDGRVIIKPQ